jgi:hypothetical protein
MNVTYSKTPKTIDFTGNGLPFEIAADNIIYPGVYARATLELFEAFTGNFKLIDINTGEYFTVYSVASPNQTNEIQSGLATTTLIAEALNAIKQFNESYFAYGVDAYLHIHAKQHYTAFANEIAYEFPDCFYLVVNDVGNTPVYYGNYSLYVRISEVISRLVQNNPPLGVPSEDDLCELTLVPDVNKVSEFSIAEIVKPSIPIVLPSLNQNTDSSFVFQYNIRVGDMHFNEAQTEFNTFKSVLHTGYAMRGKINLVDNPNYDLVADIAANKIFLNSFKKIEIFKGANCLLNFLSTGAETYTVKAKIYYTDQTNTTENIFSIGTPAGFYKINSFHASITKMNLESYNPTKEIYKYEVWVTDSQAAIVCNPVTFKVIAKPIYSKEFAYVNKFGVIEIYQAISKEDISLELDKVITQLSDSSISDAFINAHNKFKVSTGSLNRANALEMQQMIMSEGLYEIINSTYVKCIIEAGSFNIVDESADICSIDFTYRLNFDL